MHMADSLLSPAVATTMYIASAGATAVSIYKLRKEGASSTAPLKGGIAGGIDSGMASGMSGRTLGGVDGDMVERKLPTMAVMSALVFAGQMINYTIPGTGSSGHLCGGMMLAGLLGPYAGFLSMIIVLTIQCLFFADGGLLALGANVWNMAFYGCFIGYFLIYRPIMRSKLFAGSDVNSANRKKIILSSILGCVLTLQLGAFSVVLETTFSGITELPLGAFTAIMQPIHLVIGLVEGFITSAVLLFIYDSRPELLQELSASEGVKDKRSYKKTIAILAVTAVVVGGGLSLFASSNPDGLEWSLFGNSESGYSENMGLDEESYGVESEAGEEASEIQEKTSILPDYSFANDGDNKLGTSASGIIGSAMVAGIAIIICLIGRHAKRRKNHSNASNTSDTSDTSDNDNIR